MDEESVSSVTSSWRRIDAWLAAHAPATLALLNPPVLLAQLEAAQRALGVWFHQDLVESLRCHDGVSGWASLLPEESPLGAAGIAERWRVSVESASDNDGFVTHPWDDEPWWHRLWVPWGESADGNVHVIDQRPGPGYGRLGWAGHGGGGDFSDSSPGLAAYLHQVHRALYFGGGVREMYPYLTRDGQLWWDFGGSCDSLNGEPLVAAPTGLD